MPLSGKSGGSKSSARSCWKLDSKECVPVPKDFFTILSCLTSTQQGILLWIMYRSFDAFRDGARSGWVTISIAEFAKTTGLSVPAVDKAMASLKSYRLIDCEKAGKSRCYRMVPANLTTVLLMFRNLGRKAESGQGAR